MRPQIILSKALVLLENRRVGRLELNDPRKRIRWINRITPQAGEHLLRSLGRDNPPRLFDIESLAQIGSHAMQVVNSTASKDASRQQEVPRESK
jgi:hypothetical protein